MEDLKQIQEFFSKPLNENAFKVGQKVIYLGHPAVVTATKEYNGRNFVSVSYDKGTGKTKASDILTTSGDVKPLNENVFVEAFKLEKALKGMGYDVKVKAVDDFGTNVFEIYFNNPSDADDSIFYDAKKLGYDNVRVFANPQESLNEAMVDYDFSKEELIRVIKQLKRGASTEIGMIKAFEKALGRELTDDEIRGFKLEEAKKLTYNDFVQMVRDDMMAGSSPDEKPSDEQVRRRAKSYYNDYLKGISVDDLFEATKKEYDALLDKEHELTKVYSKDKTDANWKKLSAIRKKGKKLEKELEDQGLLEYNSGIYYNPDKEKHSKKKTKKSLKELAEEVMMQKGYSKYLKSKDNPKGETDGLTPDVLNKILMNVVKDIKETNQLEEGASTEEKRIAMSAIKRIAKYRGVGEDEARNDLIRAAKEIGSLEEAVKEIFETIELGKQLDEKKSKLCKRGRDYIAARKRAGEKSSAYLSGRAVKVCKGQIKGAGGKKRKDYKGKK